MQNRPAPLPSPLIAAFPPASELLLDCTRHLMDGAMLVEIAETDYGYLAAEMLAALRPIRDAGTLPTPLDSHLHEVLQLTCWSDPDHPNAPPFEPGPAGLTGHRTRLFACAVLLRAAAEPSCQYAGSCLDAVLAQCLASAMVVGAEMETALASFLTWRIPRMRDAEEEIYAGLVLLILAIRLTPAPVHEEVLGSLAEWVLAQEAKQRHSLNWNFANPPPQAFSLQLGLWQKFVQEIRVATAAISNEGIRTNLQLCTLLLEPA